MNKTFRIAFSLKNTYRVNSILFSIRQIPFIKRLFPNSLYQVRGLKVFANVVSLFWEIGAAFLGKFLYFLLMIYGTMDYYSPEDAGRLFWHILFFLTIIGSFANTYMFNPTRDKYYAMILLRMDAREYALIHYSYEMGKTLVGFTAFGLLFGRNVGLPVWQCLLIPGFVVGAKLCVTAYCLWDYEKTGRAPNENKLGKLLWVTMFLLLAAAYGLPAIGILLPKLFCGVMSIVFILAGVFSIYRIQSFGYYHQVYQELLSKTMFQMDEAKESIRVIHNNVITADTSITSNRSGFEYLNELFIQRHQKILWRSSKRIAAVSFALVLGALLLFYLRPEEKGAFNEILMTYLPYFVFIMYVINRGTGFTSALFMNCDHSLLTYSFYKRPKFILKLFWIRLREIIKVNLLPSLIIGAGLAVLLYASGGTDNPLNYIVLFVSIQCFSIFFSVHYLMLYYLLQPYNAGTEMKSGTYQLIMSGTYIFCLFMMGVKVEILIFGIMAIVFCVLYCLIASILVYRLAPRTFKLRS